MKEFIYCFQITNSTVFKVRYNSYGKNKPYFATSAMHYIQSLSECGRAGQCQKDILPFNSPARAFYDKWMPYQMQELSMETYNELTEDIGILKENYVFTEAQHI